MKPKTNKGKREIPENVAFEEWPEPNPGFYQVTPDNVRYAINNLIQLNKTTSGSAIQNYLEKTVTPEYGFKYSDWWTLRRVLKQMVEAGELDEVPNKHLFHGNKIAYRYYFAGQKKEKSLVQNDEEDVKDYGSSEYDFN